MNLNQNQRKAQEDQATHKVKKNELVWRKEEVAALPPSSSWYKFDFVQLWT